MYTLTHIHTHTHTQATLHSGLDLSQVVKVPDDQEYEDWIAVNVVDFFNRINIIYGTVCEICTDASCPMMSGGPKFEYYWADETQKKPLALSAPKVCTSVVGALCVCVCVCVCVCIK